ncbi:unnamed protein product [Effrenium voratum]|nr:unnamed protein product [Effrenium voratum]
MMMKTVSYLFCIDPLVDNDDDEDSNEIVTSSSTTNQSDLDVSVDEEQALIIAPTKVVRRCTDFGCCIAWLLFGGVVLAAVMLGSYKPERHDFIRLTNEAGTQCGVYTEVGNNFWYLCGAELGNGSFLATCVPRCEIKTSRREAYCELAWPGLTASDYDSDQVGPLCWPTNATLAANLRAQLQANGYDSIDMYITLHFAWPPLAVAGFLSILVSHTWVRVLRDHASTLAWLGVYLLVILPLVCLAYMWLAYGEVQRITAIFLVSLACMFACLACRSTPQLDKAAICLHAACQCVTDMPMLEVGPALVMISKIAWFLLMLFCLRFLPTTLHFDIRTGQPKFLFYGGPAHEVADVSCAVLYSIFALWTWNLINTFWELAISALTVLWFVHLRETGEVPGMALSLHTLWLLLRYHLGSCAMGAVCIGFVRPLRFCLGTLTAVQRMERNPFGWMEQSCCPCLGTAYGCLDRFSANAFVDLVLHSSSLRQAMEQSQKNSVRCQLVANSLNGTTFLFQTICLALTWWLGFTVSYVAVTQIPEYSEPEHFGYVPYTSRWCVTSGFIALICSYPHMMVFDTSSDAILYLDTERLILDELRQDRTAAEDESNVPVLSSLQDMARYVMSCGMPP